jgi:hypothetical protein
MTSICGRPDLVVLKLKVKVHNATIVAIHVALKSGYVVIVGTYEKIIKQIENGCVLEWHWNPRCVVGGHQGKWFGRHVGTLLWTVSVIIRS